MDEDQIATLAEDRAYELHDMPRPDDFDAAENDIRGFLDEGAWYDDEQGWTWPKGAA